LAGKALLTNTYNIEIYGRIMEIDNYFVTSKNMETGKGRNDKNFEKLQIKKRVVELMIHICQLLKWDDEV
jgi:hypothetical protein